MTSENQLAPSVVFYPVLTSFCVSPFPEAASAKGGSGRENVGGVSITDFNIRSNHSFQTA